MPARCCVAALPPAFGGSSPPTWRTRSDGDTAPAEPLDLCSPAVTLVLAPSGRLVARRENFGTEWAGHRHRTPAGPVPP